MLNALLLIIGSYFIAAMPFGYWTGKIVKGIDVREHGSGSTGATNVFRTVSKEAGVFVFIADVLKGAIPVLIAKYMEANGAFTSLNGLPPGVMPAVVAVIALVAHSKSIFLGFSGGKSAATGLGTLFALNPLGGLLTFFTWLSVMFMTKYVSVASIAAVAMCGIYFWLLQSPPAHVLYCFFGLIYVTYRHKANIKRLMEGTEPKIGQSKTENKTEPKTESTLVILFLCLTFCGTENALADQPVAVKPNVSSVNVAKAVAASIKGDQLTPDEAVNVRVYKAANRGVVNISRTTDNDIFYNVVPEQGIGSGVIISALGYILTNFHVIENANTIRVTLWDGTTLHGSLVGQDPSNDLAVLKIDVPPGKKLTIIPYGDSSKLEVGRRVFAIGNPFGFDRTMTTGIVSSLGRTLKSENNRIIKGVIQTDAAINPGNSGGPLLDSSASLVGINTAILSKSGQSAGIGLAIPSNIAKRIIPELIAHHFVSRPEIGLQCTESDGALRVVYVDPDGAAGKAGLTGPKIVVYKLPAGLIQMVDNSLADVITAVDNVAVKTNDDLLSYIEQKKAGQVVTLTVLRNKKVVKIPVKLTAASPA